MRLYNGNKYRQSRSTGYSSDEVEVPAISSPNKKGVEEGRWNGESGDRGHRHHHHHHQTRHKEDEYHVAARRFYDPPSTSSAIVETVYRRPQPFADLHQFDDVPEIDTVPTAVGFHSMDSAEEIVTARSTGGRYEMEEMEYLAEEQVKKAGSASVRTSPEGREEDEDQATIDEDFRYGPARQDAVSATGKTLLSVPSDDSDSCPPIWKTESQDEKRDRAWMIAEAKRVRELNAVKVPKNILADYETSQIVRQPIVELDDEKSTGAGKTLKLSRALRKIVGANSSGRKEYPPYQQYHQPSKAESHSATHGKISEKPNFRPSHKPKNAISMKKSPQASQKMSMKRSETEEERSVHSSKSGSRKVKPSSSSSSRKVPEKLNSLPSNESKKNFVTEKKPTQSQNLPLKRLETKEEKSDCSSKSSGSRKSKQSKNRQSINSEIKSKNEMKTERYCEHLSETKSELISSVDGSAKTEVEVEADANTAPSTTFAAAVDNDHLIMSLRSQEENEEDDGSTNMETMDTAPKHEEVSLPETTTTIQGNGITDWIINGFDSLANIGFNQPMFGFFDWNGEEKMIAELEAETERKEQDRLSGKKMPPKTKLTKRLLSQEEIQARLTEERIRRQQQEERQTRERTRERPHEFRDPEETTADQGRSSRNTREKDVSHLTSFRPETPSSVEVKTLTLDGEDKDEVNQQKNKRTSILKKDTTRAPPPMTEQSKEKEGLTIEFRTPSFVSSNNPSDDDDASTSILGLGKRRPEKAPMTQTSATTSKKRQDQKDNKKKFGLFRRDARKQQQR